ncbi:hypothetical protein B0H17DRAFT_1063523 [Mycena rosella]|uniref:Transmembrane protein n=1 Tax=Mycena rosella TaxID=1033263 RepID=A0AAD7DHE4_MYCRO|nr:hypothetical protein B0H17DRAFT_1063523 [Mycena rosella]
MARTLLPRKYIIPFVLFLLLGGALAKMLKSYCPQTAALAVAVYWTWEKCLHGVAVGNFIVVVRLLYSIATNVLPLLTGASREAPTTPSALENGRAPVRRSHELEILEAETTSILSRILLIILCNFVLLQQFSESDHTLLEKPLLHIAGATALYLVRGLGILFVGITLLRAARWLSSFASRSAAEEFRAAAESGASRPSPAVEVLFDDETVDGFSAIKEKEDPEAGKI